MTERIFLIGYRGTGKTCAAELLARRLGWAWCDADVVFEQRFDKTIRQIFDEEGESAFRSKEAAILADLAMRSRCVIATGGGVVLRPDNRVLLQSGQVIWLTATPDVIWRRLQADATTSERRPMLSQGGLAEIVELLRVREPWYRMGADFAVDTTHQTTEQVVDQILGWLQAQDSGDIVIT